jgi:hypothetical protein
VTEAVAYLQYAGRNQREEDSVRPAGVLAMLLCFFGCNLDRSISVDGATARTDGAPALGGETDEPCEVAVECQSGLCIARRCRARKHPPGIGASCGNTGDCPARTACQGDPRSADAYCTAECIDEAGCPAAFTCRTVVDPTAPVGTKRICTPRDALRCVHQSGGCGD